MSSCVMDLCLTFKLGESSAVAARESEYPQLSKERRVLLANQIAQIDDVTVEEAHRQIHEQFRVW